MAGDDHKDEVLKAFDQTMQKEYVEVFAKAQKYIERIRDRDVEFIEPPDTKKGAGVWNVWWKTTQELTDRVHSFTEFESFAAANDFLHSYDDVLIQGLVREGKGLFTKLESSENEKRALQKKLSEVEDKYLKCAEEKLGIEHKLADAKETLDTIRKEDMRNAASQNVQEGVAEGNEKEREGDDEQ